MNNFQKQVATNITTLLFHIYKNHKELMTDLRAWVVARSIADRGDGKSKIFEVSNIVNLNVKYLKRLCKRSPLFRGLNENYIYYISGNKICKLHNIVRKTRKDILDDEFINQFKSKKLFQGFITKCYAEQDRDKRFKGMTAGRISYQMLADNLNISRITAISNIKNSSARKRRNIMEYPNITFSNKKQFENWLLNNMATRIGKYVIGKNPKSYKVKYNGKNYHLIQELPHRYRFTGVSRRT